MIKIPFMETTLTYNYSQINPHGVSKFGIMYNVFLIITMIAYIAFGIALGLWDLDYANSVIVMMIDTILMSTGLVALLIMWLIYILQQSKIVNILNNLYTTHKRLKKCRRYKLEIDFSLYIITFVNVVMCFTVLILETFTTMNYTTILWAAPFIMGSSVLMQYAILLNFIIQILKSINKTIFKLGSIDTEDKSETLFFTKVLIEESIIEDINILNYSHLKLSEICSKISNFYAFPTLLTIIYFVTMTTYDLYYIIISLITDSNQFLLMLCINCGTWCLAVLTDFAVLTTSITRITREFNDTSHCILLLFNQCKMDSNTKNALAEFLNSLLHHHLEFTTYGVIDLNGFLLQNIFGTVVTYLIIFIQFRPLH
ncbi:gustatory and pheromone receptor 32a-like isoform X3 [Microplitis mediator]|uniref:gustatory and pheromone receptor 32a-like isoform X3 n=1 Tax=Microplitis mediator TaxID=375433 RepID=UPI00255715C3|nr:gustatory and pheromone receptor 32a-like isoform X3 [Microplitis mediator]